MAVICIAARLQACWSIFLDPSLCGLLGMPRAELLSDPARDFLVHACNCAAGCRVCKLHLCQGRAATGPQQNEMVIGPLSHHEATS